MSPNKSFIPAKLDLEYLQILRKMKPHITCIINTHYIGLIKQWLERLSDETFVNKYVRNTYLQRLCDQIEEGVLVFPFTESPPLNNLANPNETEDENALLSEAHGQGDVSPSSDKRTVTIIDEENAWFDISDASERSVNRKVNQQAKLIDQLHLENNELLKIINRADKQLANNENLNEKIIELQKQLANAMLRNVELQKTVQVAQEQQEEFQKEANEAHKKELEVMKDKYDRSLQNCEAHLQKSAESKYTDFSEKLKNLQDWYNTLLAKHDSTVQEQCGAHAKEIDELKALHEAEIRKCLQKQDADTEQLKELKSQIHAIKSEHQGQLENLKSSLHKQLDELRADAKQKYDAQAAQHKNHIDDERAKYHQQMLEQRTRHQNELKEMYDEHMHYVSEQKKTLEELRLRQNQLKASREECSCLQKEIDKLSREHRGCAAKVDALEKQLESQISSYQSLKVEQNTKREADLEYERTTHREAMEKQAITHRDEINAIREDFKKQVQEIEIAHKKHVQEQRVTHRKLIDRFRKKLQVNVEEHMQFIEYVNQDNLKAELLLKDECIRLYSDVRKCRMEKDNSMKEVYKLEKEVGRVQEMIKSMNTLHSQSKKEFSRKLKQMQTFYQQREKKFKMDARADPTIHSRFDGFEKNVLALEEKYKNIIRDCHANARNDMQAYAKRIADLELRIGLNLIKKKTKAQCVIYGL